MINKTLAIHFEHPDEFKLIESVKEQYKDYDDIVLVTDNGWSNPDYTVLPVFYIKFFKGIIVFLSVQSYLQYRDNFRSNQIALRSTPEELNKYNIDINKLHLAKVF